MRKYLVAITFLLTIALLLGACGNNAKQNEDKDNTNGNQSTENSASDKESNTLDETEDKSNAVSEPEKSEGNNNSSNDSSIKENNESKVNNVLSDYSSEEIEYARIWLQIGANQDIDGIYVQHISAGEPLNSDDESTLNYSEYVVQLSGTRLVDGVVTYSSNGNGTINVYHVPKRWDGKNPAGEEVYKKIIEDTEYISVDPGDDEQVEELIKMLKFN